jgi:hypothetical protein
LILAFLLLLNAVLVFGSTTDWVTGDPSDFAEGAPSSGSWAVPYLSSVSVVPPPSEAVAPGRALIDMRICAVNNGTESAFVRLSVSPHITSRDGVTPLSAQFDAQLLATSDETCWRAGGDGWYYYLDILPPGQQTPPLFTGVKLANNLGDLYREAVCQVGVVCEAVGTRTWAYRVGWWGSEQAPSAPSAAEIDGILQGRQ